MSKINNDVKLLRACVQDLYAGKRLLVRRVPRLVGWAEDPDLQTLLADAARTAWEQSKRLRATGLADGGPANLWMTGILDDAARDVRSTAPGPLLDTALVGAVRKARAAEIVSADTAIELAERMGRPEVREVVEELRVEDSASDQALAARLGPLAQIATRLPRRDSRRVGRTIGAVLAFAAVSLAASCTYLKRQDRRSEKRTRARLVGREPA